MNARPARRLVAVSALVLGFAGCGDGDPGGGDATPATTTPAGEVATTTPGRAQATGLALEVRGGEVVGGLQRVDVDRGDEVVLRVTADVADEVHVHGYDLTAPVAPGQPAEIRFTADAPGVFEVELESSHLRIAQLAVR